MKGKEIPQQKSHSADDLIFKEIIAVYRANKCNPNVSIYYNALRTNTKVDRNTFEFSMNSLIENDYINIDDNTGVVSFKEKGMSYAIENKLFKLHV